MNKWLLSLAFIIAIPFMAPNNVQAADKPFETFGIYKIYYSVFNSSFIKPDVARAYNITRGKDRVLINIAVVKAQEGGDTEGQSAVVNGTAANLMQQQKKLKFFEVREQEAVYYLATLRFTNEEVVNFSIEVKPDPNKPPYTLEFSKTLYVDS